MRPIKLTMEGFGSFCEKTEIDFSHFGSQGVYLIAGDTGSGKTTIFDAICFALYDKASGPYRNKKNFRSEYAEPGRPTEVFLEFEQRGQVYKIRRNADYERPSQRGSGLTTEAASVTFIKGNMEEYDSGTSGSGSIGDINDKIVAELGLDYNQFVQAVMLPQNMFTELVNAKTADRLEILKKIYDTDIYRQIQESLKRLLSAEKQELDRINADIGMICKRNKLTGSDELADLEARLEELKERELELDKTSRALREKGRQVQKKIDQEKERRQVIAEIEVLEKKTADMRADLAQLKEEEQAIDKKRPVVDEMKHLAKNIEDSMEDYKRISLANSDLKKDELALSSMRTGLGQAKDRLGQIKNRQGEIDKALDDKDELQKTYTADKLCLQETERSLNEIGRVKNLFENISQGEKELEKILEGFEKAKKTYIQKAKEYDRALDKYEASQSYLLASRLVDGQACPVCGSLDHPKPAERTDDTIEKESLEVFKKERDRSEESRQAASELFVGKQKVLDQQKKDFFKQELVKSLSQNQLVDELSGFESLILEREELVEKTKKDLQARLRKAKEKIAGLDKLAKERKALAEEGDRLGREIQEGSLQESKLNEQVARQKSRMETLREKLKYEDEEEAQRVLEDKKSRIRAFENSLASKRRATEEKKDSLATVQGQLLSKEKSLAGYTEEKLERLLSVFQENNDKQDYIDKSIKENVGQQSLYAEDINRMRTLLKDRQKIYDKLGPVESLANATNGNVKKAQKLDLETFVQRMYFERIVDQANIRLKTLSDSRFSLLVRQEALDKRGKAGLDLNVYDSYTAEERPLSALSGGEGFQVALSLALGLSDQVQSSMGGIEMDALFIDEGFGSLSGENLRQAMKMLSDLAAGDVLIGIISHVEELKNSIDQQILVTNTEGIGSRLAIQY